MTEGIGRGDLIISPPFMPDTRFNRSVIMITQDNPGGSHGFCLNRATNNTVNDLLQEHNVDLNIHIPLYWGGPVHPNTVWMMHSREWELESTVGINEFWAMTSNMNMFHHMCEGKVPLRFRVFYGFAAWAPGQLAAEIRGEEPFEKNSSWLIAKDPDPSFIMECPVEDLWEACTTLSGSQAVNRWLA